MGNERGNNLRRIYTKYIKRIIIAFVIWSVIYAFSKKVLLPETSWTSVARDIIIGPSHLWYLFMVVGLYMITPLLNQIVKKDEFVPYFLILALVFACIIPTIQSWYSVQTVTGSGGVVSNLAEVLAQNYNNMHMHLILGYSGYYVLGYYLDRVEIKTKMEVVIYILSASGFLATILLSDFYTQKTESPCSVFYDYTMCNVMLEVVGIFVLFKNRVSKLIRTESVILCMAKHSFGVYLVHMLVRNVIARIGLTTLSFHPWLSVPVIAGLILVISHVVTAIIDCIPILRKYMI